MTDTSEAIVELTPDIRRALNETADAARFVTIVAVAALLIATAALLAVEFNRG